MADRDGSGKIIDGKEFAERLRQRIATQVTSLKERHGWVPGLAVVLVGDDPASHVYVRNKGKATVEAGMASEEIRLPASARHAEVLARVKALDADPKVHGILVQLPLPKQVDAAEVRQDPANRPQHRLGDPVEKVADQIDGAASRVHDIEGDQPAEHRRGDQDILVDVEDPNDEQQEGCHRKAATGSCCAAPRP